MTQFNFRLSESELAKWKAKAGLIGVSAWLRSLANRECEPVRKPKKSAPRSIHEMSQIPD